MDAGKVKDVFKDWVKSGYRFGFNFSNYLFNKLEASPKTTKVGGTVFDLAAGGGLVYMAAMSAITTVVGGVLAVGAITTAPVSAVVTLAVGTIWLALAAMTGGIGLGLLDSARVKCGLSKPSFGSKGAVAAIKETATSFASVFKSDAKKSSSAFKNAVDGKPAAKEQPKAATPNANNDFSL